VSSAFGAMSTVAARAAGPGSARAARRGTASATGSTGRASRIAAPTPDGLVVHHRCGNPACVRPGHLELQSNSEHVRNHKAPGNRCKHGHEFTPENTYIAVDAKGREHRLCRACGAQRARAYRRERGLVGSAQARQTHCKRGHPFDEENTYRYQGKRICRTCRREAVRRMRKSP